MSNAPITIRSLLVLGIAAILAIFLGYIVASPFDWTALLVYGAVIGILLFPFLLKWHHPMMIIAWNMNALVFILPGRPPLWLFMVMVSLLFSLGQYALDKRARYLWVPRLGFPLLFFTAVIFITAKFTGGISLGSLGGSTAGGKRYFLLLGAILGYFAFTCHEIPIRRASKYVTGFFLGGLTTAIGNLLPLVNLSVFYVVFLIFPPDESGLQALGLVAESGITRLGGLTFANTAIFCSLLAAYGIAGVFDISGPLRFLPFQFRGGFQVNKPWRLLFFFLAVSISLLGGFRSVVLIFALTFFFQFCFEKLFQTKLFPAFVIMGLLAAAIALPLANKLPLSMQRALAVIPFLELDPAARMSAAGSNEWRLEMWRRVLPEVPQYLWLGKGYALKSHEVQVLSDETDRDQSSSMDMAILAGDYHNGPLSLIIPFGIWGVFAFIWFVVASIKVLLRNYRFGDPAIRHLNRFLLSFFIARTIFFVAVFGSLYSDMAFFTGIVGLSVALNGGVRNRPAPELRNEESALATS